MLLLGLNQRQGVGQDLNSLREGAMKPDRKGRKVQEPVNGMVPKSGEHSLQYKIALRAYDLYLQRGGVDGHAEDDWLQAEQEILKEERQ